MILYGTADRVGRKIQMAVPEFEMVPKAAADSAHRSLHMGRVVPIYPATSGLHQRDLREAAAAALKALIPTLEKSDLLPEVIRQRHGFTDYKTAVIHVHFPPAPEAVEKAKERLTFDELLAFQIAMGIRRRRLATRPGIAHQTEGDLVEHWMKLLPFTLTPGQERSLQEIARDMASPKPMRRLLQGEVGSGKTVVAAYGMVVALQNGCQSVVMAPTEVLARQHALTLSQLLAPIDVSVGLLTSSMDEPSRRSLGQELAGGTVSVLVGTHAVLEPWITFPKLGLVVIDEQQKFGVDQRNAIAAKGNHPDLLILTATPIPRTLALTLYGEMEVSTITERPAGRQPVRTLWMDSTRREEVYTFVRSELDAGRQAYVVCPRIGKQEGPPDTLLDPTQGKRVSATEMFKEYQKIFSGHPVGLLHGQMTSKEQKGIFAAFKHGEMKVLVATQVIEVGVDVANATVMVIEGAERFGLSQLHQLRGRVGRGKHDATCILMADPKNVEGAERIRTMCEVSDAFKIAEQDLRLRGPGELLGKRQAGLPDLKCLEWATEGPWLEISKEEAEQLLKVDPELKSPEVSVLYQDASRRFLKLTDPCA